METSSLRTLKIMPRNLNEIVRSWIRLLEIKAGEEVRPPAVSGGHVRRISHSSMHPDTMVLFRPFHRLRDGITWLACAICQVTPVHNSDVDCPWWLGNDGKNCTLVLQLPSKSHCILTWSFCLFCHKTLLLRTTWRLKFLLPHSFKVEERGGQSLVHWSQREKRLAMRGKKLVMLLGEWLTVGVFHGLNRYGGRCTMM